MDLLSWDDIREIWDSPERCQEVPKGTLDYIYFGYAIIFSPIVAPC